MAYYFAVETTQDCYEGVNIKKTEAYKEKFESDGKYACTLEEINQFTTMFQDENNLRNILCSDKALSWNRYHNPLAIIYEEGINRRKVQGNVLLSNSKKYLENPNLVIEYFMQKANENDKEFFEKIKDKLPENSAITCLVVKTATLIEKRLSGLENKVDLRDNELIIKTIKSLIYNHYIGETGEIEIIDEVNYENLHSVVSYIHEYEQYLLHLKSSSYKRTRTK